MLICVSSLTCISDEDIDLAEILNNPFHGAGDLC